MGAKNPDRAIMPPSPLTAFTLAEMHMAKWELRARCSRCAVELRVDLPAMIRVFGPDAIGGDESPGVRPGRARPAP